MSYVFSSSFHKIDHKTKQCHLTDRYYNNYYPNWFNKKNLKLREVSVEQAFVVFDNCNNTDFGNYTEFPTISRKLKLQLN